jgi:uncharacterized protein (DUF2252 family)
LRAIDAAAPRLSRGPIGEILGKMAVGDQTTLLDLNTRLRKNGTRRIVRSRAKHPALSRKVRDEVISAVTAYGLAKGNPEYFRPIDATRRIAGIGSLGVERYLVLVAGGGSAETNQLLDIKQALPSVLPPIANHEPFPSSEAARVVHAQRTLQAAPTAGLDVMRIRDEDFRVREMVPEENRSSLDRFQEKPARLREAIVAAGWLTGLSHLRGAAAETDPGVGEALAHWARGAALDSVLAAAARYAEKARLEFKQFRAELRAPDALPEPLRESVLR